MVQLPTVSEADTRDGETLALPACQPAHSEADPGQAEAEQAPEADDKFEVEVSRRR